MCAVLPCCRSCSKPADVAAAQQITDVRITGSHSDDASPMHTVRDTEMGSRYVGQARRGVLLCGLSPFLCLPLAFIRFSFPPPLLPLFLYVYLFNLFLVFPCFVLYVCTTSYSAFVSTYLFQFHSYINPFLSYSMSTLLNLFLLFLVPFLFIFVFSLLFYVCFIQHTLTQRHVSS
jgi:hypothetical protein